jgi:hypothetical protein
MAFLVISDGGTRFMGWLSFVLVDAEVTRFGGELTPSRISSDHTT